MSKERYKIIIGDGNNNNNNNNNNMEKSLV